MLRIALAVVHLLGLAVGSIYGRARAMNDLRDTDSLRRGFTADNWWGVSAGILIARIARISDVQTLLLIGIVAAAVMMARGYGAR